MGREGGSKRISSPILRPPLTRKLPESSRRIVKPSRANGQPRGHKGVAWYGNVAAVPREGVQGELEKELAATPQLGGVGTGGVTKAKDPVEKEQVGEEANRKTWEISFLGTSLDKGTSVRWWLRTRGKKKKHKKSKKSWKSSRKHRKRVNLAAAAEAAATAAATAACKTYSGDFDTSCHWSGFSYNTWGGSQSTQLAPVMLKYFRFMVFGRM